jgi:hypothetical protein
VGSSEAEEDGVSSVASRVGVRSGCFSMSEDGKVIILDYIVQFLSVFP